MFRNRGQREEFFNGRGVLTRFQFQCIFTPTNWCIAARLCNAKCPDGAAAATVQLMAEQQ